MQQLMVEFLVNFRSLGDYMAILSKGQGGSYDFIVQLGHQLGDGSYSLQMKINVPGKTCYSVGIPIFPNMLNTWHYVLFSYDGSKICSYFDANLVGCTASGYCTGTITVTQNGMVIGRSHVDWDGEEFDGQLDNIRIYSRGLEK